MHTCTINFSVAAALVLSLLGTWITNNDNKRARTTSTAEKNQICPQLISRASRLAGKILYPPNKSGERPPSKPPTDIQESLTMNWSVPLEFYYVDDTNKGKGTHYKYPAEDIESYILQASHQASIIYSVLQQDGGDINKAWRRFSKSTQWLMMALHRYPINGSNVVVFGSTEPWYEAIALAFNADYVTTVEYNNLTYKHPDIMTTTPDKFYSQEFLHYDAAFSISSFDHDGLGRYGDPIDPDADLMAMQLVQCALKPNGLLFLTVPIGPDVVVWNLHRRYGKLRLPKLLDGWIQEDIVGWDEERLTQNASWRRTYEPVFVLRNNHGKM